MTQQLLVDSERGREGGNDSRRRPHIARGASQRRPLPEKGEKSEGSKEPHGWSHAKQNFEKHGRGLNEEEDDGRIIDGACMALPHVAIIHVVMVGAGAKLPGHREGRTFPKIEKGSRLLGPRSRRAGYSFLLSML